LTSFTSSIAIPGSLTKSGILDTKEQPEKRKRLLLWDYRYPGCARKFLDSWIQRAKAARIKPLTAFARTLENYWYGLINHCYYPIDTAKLEGMNNKIKVIKRIAYGFHDDDYFILKIKQACRSPCPIDYIC